MGKEKLKKTKATITNLEKKEMLNVLAEKKDVDVNKNSPVSFTNDVFIKFSYCVNYNNKTKRNK